MPEFPPARSDNDGKREKKNAEFALKNAKPSGEKGANDVFVKGCPRGRVKTARNQKID